MGIIKENRARIFKVVTDCFKCIQSIQSMHYDIKTVKKIQIYNLKS